MEKAARAFLLMHFYYLQAPDTAFLKDSQLTSELTLETR